MAESVIPTLEGELKVPVLETDMETVTPIRDEALNTLAHERLVAGHDKYGVSWTEVDLKQDALEEAYDLLNYPRMALQRVEELINAGQNPFSGREYVRFVAAVERSLDLAQAIIREINEWPDFEGPTSQEWVAQRAKKALDLPQRG